MTLNAYECWEQNFFLEVWVRSLYSFIFGALASLVSQGAHVETVHWTRGDSGKRRACRLPSEKKAWMGLSVLGGSVWGFRCGDTQSRPLIFLASPSCMPPDKSRNYSEPQSPPLKLVTMPVYPVVETECSDLYRLVCVCRVGAQWTSSPSLKREKLA